MPLPDYADADLIDAAAKYLDSDELRVFCRRMPGDRVTDESALTRFVVVNAGGLSPSAGDESWAPIARWRADLRCYGSDEQQAADAYRIVARKLREMKLVTVAVGPPTDQRGVLLHNAVYLAGPFDLRDPQAKWAVCVATWGVHGATKEVEAPVSVITVGLTSSEDMPMGGDLSNSDKLRWNVKAQTLYAFHAVIAANFGTADATFRFVIDTTSGNIDPRGTSQEVDALVRDLRPGGTPLILQNADQSEVAIHVIDGYIFCEEDGQCIVQTSQDNGVSANLEAGSYIIVTPVATFPLDN